MKVLLIRKKRTTKSETSSRSWGLSRVTGVFSMPRLMSAGSRRLRAAIRCASLVPVMLTAVLAAVPVNKTPAHYTATSV